MNSTEWIREKAAMELFDPIELRRLAASQMDVAHQALDFEHWQTALEASRLATDLQAKALELENRSILKGVA